MLNNSVVAWMGVLKFDRWLILVVCCLLLLTTIDSDLVYLLLTRTRDNADLLCMVPS